MSHDVHPHELYQAAQDLDRLAATLNAEIDALIGKANQYYANNFGDTTDAYQVQQDAWNKSGEAFTMATTRAGVALNDSTGQIVDDDARGAALFS